MENLKYTLLFLFFTYLSFSQTKFKIKTEETDTWRDQYYLVDKDDNVLRKLDTSRYKFFFSENSLKYFAVIGVKGKPGWSAIDINENVLFEVYNQSDGEPNPDFLRENKIRIVDDKKRIGFANHKGEIIIKPQFEIVTYFIQNKAIFGRKCKKVYWDKSHNDGCNHYSIKCSEHGYINEKGKILKVGKYTFEDIAKEIDWKPIEDY